ncbi:hypothetical protein IKG10_01440 [Candidatus Saccharibacteria bacterium]|nr:hypothetical protein [Candidatus Saccharibacteria bacterium]
MANSIKKRGQKIARKFSRASIKASENSRKHIKENFINRISHVESIRLLVFEWMLMISALIILAIAQAFWFGNSYAEDVFTTGGTYTEATLGEVGSLNPLFATTSSEKALSKLLFATISNNDYSGHPGIGLAESIRADENGKTWIVKLRDNLKWSDNEPITNDDVLFTIQLIKDPSVNSIYDSDLSNVKATVNEAGEIVFSLPTPYADFMSALDFPIVPKHILENVNPKTLVEDSFSVSPVTSGAFFYNATQTSADGERVYYLSSNPDYYKGKTMLSSFAIHTYNTKDSIINAINTGSVTATAELSEIDASQINTSQFIQKNTSLNSGAFIFFNTSHENVKQRDLREAIRQGIDLSTIRAQAPDTLTLDYPLINAQIQIENYPDLPEHNAEEAKAKIAELSAENPIHIDIATVNSGYLPNVAASIKSELENLGIEATVSAYEENQDFITNIISKRNYDILVYEIELGADPDLLPYYHSSQASAGGLNLSNYKDTLVDDLLLGARDTLDEELRIKKYESFLERWVTNVPAIGLYRANLTYFYNKNVKTFGNDVKPVTAIDRFVDISSWSVSKTTKNKTP